MHDNNDDESSIHINTKRKLTDIEKMKKKNIDHY